VAAVSRKHGFALRHVIGRDTTPSIRRARLEAMWAAREYTDASLPQIGRYFDGRHHTSILYAYRKFSTALLKSPNNSFAAVEGISASANTPLQ
jgi:chromosomal replication initiator protein